MNQKNKMSKGILGLWVTSLLVISGWAAGLSFIIDSDGVPNIDGVADAVYEDAITYNISNLVTGTVSSSSDLSATYKALWDTNYLYFLIEVSDEAASNDSADTWNDDSIEIYLDADYSQLTSYGPKDYLYAWRWGDTTISELAHGATAGVEFASTEQIGGYTFEIKIPWDTLEVTAVSGMLIGLDIHVNDDDDGGLPDGKLTWHTLTNESGFNPSLFGTAELYRVGGGNGFTGTVEVSSDPTSVEASSETETVKDLPTAAELASKATHEETLSLLTALEKGQSADRSRLSALVEEVRQDPNLSEHDRFVIASRVGGLDIKETPGLTRATRFAAYEELAKTLMAEFPDQVEPYESLLALANDHDDSVKGEQLARQLLSSVAPASVKNGAQRLLNRKAMVDNPIDLSLQDSEGVTLNLSELQGKVVVLYAWTALGENSHLWVSRLLEKGGENVVFVGLNLDADTQAAQTKINCLAPGSLQLYDPGGLNGALASQLNLGRVPSVYLIDHSGIVRAVDVWKELPEKLTQLVKEGGQS